MCSLVYLVRKITKTEYKDIYYVGITLLINLNTKTMKTDLTRSIIRIHSSASQLCHLAIYCPYDGYPAGQGAQIAKAIKSINGKIDNFSFALQKLHSTPEYLQFISPEQSIRMDPKEDWIYQIKPHEIVIRKVIGPQHNSIPEINYHWYGYKYIPYFQGSYRKYLEYIDQLMPLYYRPNSKIVA